jgi:Sigma-54 interaction domain
MGSSSQVSAVGRPREPYQRVSQLPDHWRLARAAHVDLLLMGVPRVNLILIAPEGVVRYVLESDLLDLRAPTVEWSPGEPLDLRPCDRIGTLILHDVGNLPLRDQLDLLEWLERVDGRVQVIGTSPTPLMPRMNSGEFIDTLYYRLNTVCVDVTG